MILQTILDMASGAGVVLVTILICQIIHQWRLSVLVTPEWLRNNGFKAINSWEDMERENLTVRYNGFEESELLVDCQHVCYFPKRKDVIREWNALRRGPFTERLKK